MSLIEQMRALLDKEKRQLLAEETLHPANVVRRVHVMGNRFRWTDSIKRQVLELLRESRGDRK